MWITDGRSHMGKHTRMDVQTCRGPFNDRYGSFTAECPVDTVIIMYMSVSTECGCC